MATDIKVPSFGESVSEGVLSRWLKEDGDFVSEGESLFELETEKATQEIPAPAGGVLKITVHEGETVEVDSIVGSIDEDAAADQSKQKSKPQQPEDQTAEESQPQQEQPQETEQHVEGKEADEQTDTTSDDQRISPAARNLIAEHNIEPNYVDGSGPGGLITKEDVVAYLGDGDTDRQSDNETAEPSPPPTPKKQVEAGREVRKPLSAIRLRIADRLLASQRNTATLTTFNEADLSNIMHLRSKYKDRFRDQHDVNLGFMSFFVKASVEALRAFPLVNARLDGNEVVYHNYYDIGVAVSTDRGLMVPIVRDAHQKSFAEVEKVINDLAIKARDGKIAYTDLQGGTFTITNGGIFGSLLSTPILNAPQTAILGMHTIQKRPVVVDDEIVIRPMMYLALSYDHRLIDGREAVQFLIRIKECVEDPERMLLSI